jgi:hypothetical protein
LTTVPGRTRPTIPSSSSRPCSAWSSATTPGLWSLTELDRHLHPSSDTPAAAEPSRAATEDAIEDLYAAGLIHRIGTFVCATRAAYEAELINA